MLKIKGRYYMVNRIVLNETSYHGSGAIKEIVNEVKGRNLKKAFVCSDPDLIKFNVTTKVTNILEESNLEYEIYSNIKPNPTIENVQNGVNAYKKSNADYIIAIGGGSSIDTAKAIGIIINNPEFEDDHIVLELQKGYTMKGKVIRPMCTYNSCTNNSRNSSRSYYKLCYNRC